MRRAASRTLVSGAAKFRGVGYSNISPRDDPYELILVHHWQASDLIFQHQLMGLND
jgi:hypothetical protein